MKKIILLFAVLLVSTMFQAQQFQQHSLWYYQSSVINPAFTGWGNGLSITLDKRMQWMGWKGAPRTNFIGLDMPVFYGKLGLGANLISDKVGVRNFQTASFNLAYHLSLGRKKGELSFGLTGGLNTLSADFTSLFMQETADINAYNLEKAKKFSAGFGVVWHTSKFYVGASAPLLQDAAFTNDSASVKMNRHYFIQSGYLFKLSALWRLRSNLNVKTTGNTPISVDVANMLVFDNRVGMGISARWKESIGVPLMFNVTEFFTLAYSYEFPLNGMLAQQRGSHEVLINFNIHGRPKAVASPRFF